MDIKSLRYFNEVLLHKSLRRAGDKLHITQPALSRYVKSLEDELGLDLFVRTARGVAPTEAAHVLADGARRIFNDLDHLTALVRSLAATPAGTLRIGVLPAFGRHFAAKVIGDMRRHHPNLKFQLIEGFSDKLRAMVLADELDVAIIAEYEAHPDLEKAKLYDEQLWLIGCSTDWKFGSGPIEQEQLRNVPLIASRFVRNMIRQKIVSEEVNNVIEIDGASVLPDLLDQNIAYYLGPPTMLWSELQSGRFIGAKVRDLSFKREMIWRKDRPKTASVAMLLDNSLQAIAEFQTFPTTPVTTVDD